MGVDMKKSLAYMKKHLKEKEYGELTALPDNFDARVQWPNCPTIKEVRDQGNCGSCWVRLCADSTVVYTTVYLMLNPQMIPFLK